MNQVLELLKTAYECPKVNHEKDNLTKWDWLLFLILTAICYVSFCQQDLIVTGNRSWLLFESRFFDYYEVLHNWTEDYGANYLPSTFFVFAVWNLPLKLLGFSRPETILTSRLIYMMWYKLLPTIIYVISGALVFKLSIMLGMRTGRAKTCMYAFLTCPVAFFGQFIFSQYDILTVFFMLLGLICYYRNQPGDMVWFSVLFGVALTFKYFALLIFLVLILLEEKRVPQLIKYSAIMAIPFVLECALFVHSEDFVKGVFGFNALGYVDRTDFSTALGSASFSKVLCVVLVIWAYFTEPKDYTQKRDWSLYLSCGMCFVLFGLIKWHPQWLIFAAPFWVISAYTNKHTEKFLWLDTLFAPIFYLFGISTFKGIVDEAMLEHGVWKYYLSDCSVVRRMADFLPSIDDSSLYSILIALILVFFVFKHPKYAIQDMSKANEKGHIKLLRIRFLVVVLAFVIPAGCSILTTNANDQKLTFSAETAEELEWRPLLAEYRYAQQIEGASGDLEWVQFYLATYDRENTCDLWVEIRDVTTGACLGKKGILSNEVENGVFHKVTWENIHLENGNIYAIEVYSTNATDDNCFALAIVPDRDIEDKYFCTLQGVEQQSNFQMELYISGN